MVGVVQMDLPGDLGNIRECGEEHQGQEIKG